jgi:hypothetical protein
MPWWLGKSDPQKAHLGKKGFSIIQQMYGENIFRYLLAGEKNRKIIRIHNFKENLNYYNYILNFHETLSAILPIMRGRHIEIGLRFSNLNRFSPDKNYF